MAPNTCKQEWRLHPWQGDTAAGHGSKSTLKVKSGQMHFLLETRLLGFRFDFIFSPNMCRCEVNWFLVANSFPRSSPPFFLQRKTVCIWGVASILDFWCHGEVMMSLHTLLGVDMIAYKCNFIYHINPGPSRGELAPVAVITFDEYYCKQISFWRVNALFECRANNGGLAVQNRIKV